MDRIDKRLPPGEKIFQIAISKIFGHFRLLLTHTGHLYSFGKNRFGQLGLGHNNNVNTLQPVNTDFLGDERVVRMAAGYGYSYLLTNKNHLYSCGYNADGRLGLNHNDEQSVFQRVGIGLEESERIVTLSLGNNHVLVSTSHNHLYFCGKKTYLPQAYRSQNQLEQIDSAVLRIFPKIFHGRTSKISL